jgi:hypothetical protein
VSVRPLCFAAVPVQDRVAAFDRVERLQDRVAPDVEAVAAHPLDLAYPHRHPRQFGGVRVDLDPLDRLRANARKLARQV